MCIYIYIYIYTFVHICRYKYTYICGFICVNISERIHTEIYLHTCTCVLLEMYACTYMHLYV